MKTAIIFLLLTCAVARAEFLTFVRGDGTTSQDIALRGISEALRTKNHVDLLALGSEQWRAALTKQNIESLGDWSYDASQTERIEVVDGFVERVKPQRAYYVLRVHVKDRFRPQFYYCHIILQKTDDDKWRYLNLPFRDFALPFAHGYGGEKE